MRIKSLSKFLYSFLEKEEEETFQQVNLKFSKQESDNKKRILARAAERKRAADEKWVESDYFASNSEEAKV